MMVDLTLLLTALNSIILIGGAIYYFKSHFVVMDMETYNQVADALDEYNAIQEKSQELAGGEGYGFFREAIEESEEEED